MRTTHLCAMAITASSYGCSSLQCGAGTEEVDGFCVAVPNTPTGNPTGTQTTNTGTTTTTGTTNTTTTTGACAEAIECVNTFSIGSDDGDMYAEVQQCRTVTGDLEFSTFSFTDDPEFPCLESVGGSLRFGASVMFQSNMRSFSAPRLQSVGDELLIDDREVEEVLIPSLFSAGNVLIEEADGLVTIDMGSLAVVDDLEILYLSRLKTLDGFDTSILDIPGTAAVVGNRCLSEADVDAFLAAAAPNAQLAVNYSNGAGAPCP